MPLTYDEAITYLYSQLPMFSRVGSSAYKENLDNTHALLKALGNPHKNFKSIHIAGTNGKGSSSHMLASALQTAGYNTGLYTSPHIKDFGERIRINGKMIDKDFVIQFIQDTKKIVTQISPSFFELTVAMAFLYFSTNEVDIAVIETGLGGRLDSTNVIIPELSIITNIGLDHTDILGDTLEKIANEKAGIIKSHIPIIVGEILPETLPVFQAAAKKMQSPLTLASNRYSINNTSYGEEGISFIMEETDTKRKINLTLDVLGIYQSKNTITAYSALQQLIKQGWGISGENIRDGFKNIKKNTGLFGRWDVLQHYPTIILDVGHNVSGFKEILHHLNTQYPNRNYHFIIGFVKDKNINSILATLPKKSTYYFTQAHIPRALDANNLKQQAEIYSLHGEVYEDVNRAVQLAKECAANEDIIIICGSFYVLSELAF